MFHRHFLSRHGHALVLRDVQLEDDGLVHGHGAGQEGDVVAEHRDLLVALEHRAVLVERRVVGAVVLQLHGAGEHVVERLVGERVELGGEVAEEVELHARRVVALHHVWVVRLLHGDGQHVELGDVLLRVSLDKII